MIDLIANVAGWMVNWFFGFLGWLSHVLYWGFWIVWTATGVTFVFFPTVVFLGGGGNAGEETDVTVQMILGFSMLLTVYVVGVF